MQQNDLAYKQKILIDGEEIPGLVSCNELPFEEGIIDVPEYSYTRHIKNGVTNMPVMQLVYKVGRDTNTFTFFKNWKDNNENHNLTVVDTDASGTEISRTLYSDCECAKYTKPAYDAANPTYFQTALTIVPYDVIIL